MPLHLALSDFLDQALHLPVVDVRSPAEFVQGRVPGAVNLPLFSDAERAEIGTAYVRQGRQPAVLLGLATVGPRLAELGSELLRIASKTDGRLLIHCWRGGMRSASMSWLAEQVGCRPAILAGGYKTFRHWALDAFADPRPVRVVAGLTGSGKTSVLRALAALGESVIDLEGLACHKGSAFGALGEHPQPSQEQFENELALAWHRSPPDRPVWIEDESRNIGRRFLPSAFWQAKQEGAFAVLSLPESARLSHLVDIYGSHPPQTLETVIRSIQKRLGGLRTSQAIDALLSGDLASACRIVLAYYDRAYQQSLDAIPASRRRLFAFDQLNPDAIARVLTSTSL